MPKNTLAVEATVGYLVPVGTELGNTGPDGLRVFTNYTRIFGEFNGSNVNPVGGYRSSCANAFGGVKAARSYNVSNYTHLRRHRWHVILWQRTKLYQARHRRDSDGWDSSQSVGMAASSRCQRRRYTDRLYPLKTAANFGAR
ncbi:hypothetical protein ACNJYA_10370 [Bradyrhizobium sp. DASA03068]|uniref:hypothetical protein n=1 Tax=Bradyrhizobium sp. BLXBL-01 TaxID=3395915 RepID=UPI003F6EB639